MKIETKPEYIEAESWVTFSKESYENHIPRWKQEREAALKWLKAYKEKHGF